MTVSNYMYSTVLTYHSLMDRLCLLLECVSCFVIGLDIWPHILKLHDDDDDDILLPSLVLFLQYLQSGQHQINSLLGELG